jgi:hypothetical protein
MRLLARLFGAVAGEDHHHHHPVLTDEEWVIYICIVVGLVLLAGLMSGLTLGLMSLDMLDMEVCPLAPILCKPCLTQPSSQAHVSFRFGRFRNRRDM